MSTIYNQTDVKEIEQLLVGRRIVEAIKGDFTLPGLDDPYRWRDVTGQLVLDDGTVVYIAPHIGGCSCGAGDYELTSVATVDNIITSARVVTEDENDDYDSSTSYRIYVIAENQEINAVQIDGNDGNGYYGTGYELFVIPAQENHQVTDKHAEESWPQMSEAGLSMADPIDRFVKALADTDPGRSVCDCVPCQSSNITTGAETLARVLTVLASASEADADYYGLDKATQSALQLLLDTVRNRWL
jgi:hypothetical protein